MSRLALTTLVLEAAFGYPGALDLHAPHPVRGLGAAISILEQRWNRPKFGEVKRKQLGVLTVALVGGGAALTGALIARALRDSKMKGSAVGLIATVGLAQRSLYQHINAVQTALERGNLPAARAAVAKVVGRDTEHLTASEIAAAALESLAESFNDGVVAPTFWLALGGLPGLFAYKAVNTADSMIGHKEPRWRSFGWAAARTDDLMNLAPARLAGALIASAGGGGWRAMVRTARKHDSPNAGWPEAAMAGALGVRLGGPVHYGGMIVERPIFGDGLEPTATDLKRGLVLYVKACGLLWLCAGVSACRH